MSQETERHLVIAQLREEIRRLERRPGRRDGVLPCGLEAIDAVLPGGGFRCGAITELWGGWASGKTSVALALLASLAPDALAAWVDGRGELYPPAARARGVDLARLLVVRPNAPRAAVAGRLSPGEPAGASSRGLREADVQRVPASNDAHRADARRGLWAAEALLASGAFAAVAIDIAVPRAIAGADAVARRLQAAAERGGAVGLWLASGKELRVPAAARLELAADGERIVARRAMGGGGGHRAA
jgi:protein ImuA